jgi:hypothetical protein
MLTAFFASWAGKIVIGFVTSGVIGIVKKYTPAIWSVIPEPVRPLASLILGAVAAGAATVADPVTTVATVATAAAAGAGAGAVGKAVRDAVREVVPAGPDFLNPTTPEP